MIFFTLLSLAIYLIFISIVLIGWTKSLPTRQTFKEQNQKLPFLSILIAFRNEEHNIKNLLNDLNNQKYPEELYEIILVDDHSEDCSIDIVKKWKKENTILIENTPLEKGKKIAIHKAVKKAKGEICLTTDADCRLPPDWIMEIGQCMANDNYTMVLGPVLMIGKNNFITKIQQLDFLSLSITSIGLANIKRPIMGNAANMAFLKKEFLSLDPFRKNTKASGDDTFLLLKMKNEKNRKIHFLRTHKVLVKTNVEHKLKKIFHQRLRWASKNNQLADTESYIVLFTVLVANLSLIISPFLTKQVMYNNFIWFFFTKLLADTIIIHIGNKFFKYPINFPVIIFFELIYPFYILFIGFTSLLFKYEWKGRKSK